VLIAGQAAEPPIVLRSFEDCHLDILPGYAQLPLEAFEDQPHQLLLSLNTAPFEHTEFDNRVTGSSARRKEEFRAVQLKEAMRPFIGRVLQSVYNTRVDHIRHGRNYRTKVFAQTINFHLRHNADSDIDRDGPACYATQPVTEHPIAVRQATIGDLDLVAPLFDAYRQFYRMPGDPGLARQFLRERFEHNQSIVLLALRRDGSAAGFTQLYPSFSSVSAVPILILNDLFVVPEARRNRVGSLLLAAAARYGRDAGAIRLTLATEVTNAAAQALYESEGWTRQTAFYAYDLSLHGTKPPTTA
jgi:GNAT superfamily N-acetyltransferase